MHLQVAVRVGRIDHVQDDVRVPGLLEGALKCLDQVMRKLPDESDRVRQQDLLPIRKCQVPGRRVQRREELVLLQDARAGQPV